MRNIFFIIMAVFGAFFCGFYTKSYLVGKSKSSAISKPNTNTKSNNMKLGAFSISLNVKDLKASKEFYEKAGFTAFGGSMKDNYLIMKNDNALIGLFQGMFKGNILTFNPGWDENAKNLDSFDDVRTIQKHLKKQGIAINPEADENSSGPASFMITDPDGNVLLFDQHR